jgi:hypothetical protein
MDPEQWKKHHEKFVESMVQILANRPRAEILVFIDNGEGVEFYSSTQNALWLFGVMKIVNEKMLAEHRHHLAIEMHQADRARLEAEFQSAADIAKGSVN